MELNEDYQNCVDGFRAQNLLPCVRIHLVMQTKQQEERHTYYYLKLVLTTNSHAKQFLGCCTGGHIAEQAHMTRSSAKDH
jgi:hypothetical protein